MILYIQSFLYKILQLFYGLNVKARADKAIDNIKDTETA